VDSKRIGDRKRHKDSQLFRGLFYRGNREMGILRELWVCFLGLELDCVLLLGTMQ
jgi:hypothetical protein